MGCSEKQQKFLESFNALSSQEEKYFYLMELGKNASSLPKEEHRDEDLVTGCQSLLYLQVTCQNGLLKIRTYSDALISSGLAYLLTQIYDNEPPESVFKHPPLFIKKMGLLDALSPSRANGLKALYNKLQVEAAKWLK